MEEWEIIVKNCREQFNGENTNMIVTPTMERNKYTKHVLEDLNVVLHLKGRADGLIYKKDLPDQPIGLFRVMIEYPNPSINDLREIRETRTQILLKMYNLSTAYIWRYNFKNMEVFEKTVVNRDDNRINEIFKDMCAMKPSDQPEWSVTEYLEQKYPSVL